jgi:hypothetical protein
VADAVGPRAQLLTRGAAAVATATESQSLPHAMPVAILERIRLIARTLEREPGLTSHELADRLGVGRRHMSLLLLRLEEHGHVVHVDRRWFPGPDGVD